MKKQSKYMEKMARISECGLYRYVLGRRWSDGGAICAFIGLNPSTADAEVDDPTIRRCIGFAKDWGYDAIYMVNLFAFRATDPQVMKAAQDPIGPENDDVLKAVVNKAAIIIAAWGINGSYLGRDIKVMQMIPFISCLGVTKNGYPRHPLYLPKTVKPQDFN